MPHFLNGGPPLISDEARLKDKVNSIGSAIHGFLNEETGAAASIGFFLLVFPVSEDNQVETFQYITNGVSGADIVALMKTHIAHVEGGGNREN